MPSSRRPSKDSTSSLNDKLPSLLSHQDWKQIRRLFLSRESHYEMVAAIEACSCSASQTMLHYVCRFHPPMDVVMMLYKAYPQAICLKDKKGRYPLHMACRSGASPSVIRFLCAKNPHALSLPDRSGSTPLHYVCQSYERQYDPTLELDPDLPPEDALVQVVDMICKIAPESLNIEDNEDRNAVEIAIECEIPWDAVQTLQKTSEKDWKVRQEESREFNMTVHDAIQHHIDEQEELVESRIARMAPELRRKQSLDHNRSKFLPVKGRGHLPTAA
mmetsp:Transcript_9956/g.16672  ORF Transcript_9956/g.16672 Transcript_9956/m.16672 type:complete len:274 (-) Transcript_9956:165-986(-)|eukprot:CAMPEP_0116561710 /NCGR_PEP_ID=MMETSP0397-20121206/11736_1 /TAXON_ID=216820 /ORGANISM="Cyclophora tenuis, Strain ECT3854" /LENGTH=273 /DNA_ID=CAMNT_0004087887 /DNA_START=16 /DNA_END=837 /DNA_ORIENTATION=+